MVAAHRPVLTPLDHSVVVVTLAIVLQTMESLAMVSYTVPSSAVENCDFNNT